MSDLEDGLRKQCSSPVEGFIQIGLPAIGHIREGSFLGHLRCHAELDDMQPMIEGTSNHRKSRSGMLIQRPIPDVVGLKM